MRLIILLLCGVASSCSAASQKYTTPVPILKQINKHHEDGSYSYGYEAADGTYKIETKYANGEVYGKYGYFDDQGQLREVEYGASRRGFEPAGSQITVAPPTVNNDKNYPPPPLGPDDEDDGQYREDPSVYYANEQRNNNDNNNYRQEQQPRPVYNAPRYTQPAQRNSYQQPIGDIFDEFQSRPAKQQHRPAITNYRPQTFDDDVDDVQQRERPRPQPVSYQRYEPPAFRPTTHFGFQQQQAQAQPQPRPVYNPPPPPPSYNPYNNYNTQHHPKDPNVNVDYFSGSYSVNYK